MVPFEGNNSKQKTVVAITKTANPSAMFANCYSVANGNKTSTTGSPHRGGNEVMKHNVGGSIDSESLSSSSSFDCEALGAELISTMMEGNIDGEFMEGTSDEQEEMLEGVLAMQRVSEAGINFNCSLLSFFISKFIKIMRKEHLLAFTNKREAENKEKLKQSKD